jgi:hypothetical protein
VRGWLSGDRNGVWGLENTLIIMYFLPSLPPEHMNAGISNACKCANLAKLKDEVTSDRWEGMQTQLLGFPSSCRCRL